MSINVDNLSDDELRDVIYNSKNLLLRRQMGGFADIPEKELAKLSTEYNKVFGAKHFNVKVSIEVPVYLLSDDSGFFYNCDHEPFDDVEAQLAASSKIKNKIKKANERYKKLEEKVDKLAKKYDTQSGNIWDELENRLHG